MRIEGCFHIFCVPIFTEEDAQYMPITLRTNRSSELIKLMS